MPGGGVPAPGMTVIVALPDLPARAAVITAVPAPTPVIRPAVEIVATELLLVLQVTIRFSRIRPRQSRSVDVAVVVSPTAIELERSDTVTDAMRLASADKSSEVGLVVPVMPSPEHENMLSIARPSFAPLVSVRFMMPLMNRATGFSRAACSPANCYAARHSRSSGGTVATGNAIRTARMYIRQAKRSFRHWKCVVFY